MPNVFVYASTLIPSGLPVADVFVALHSSTGDFIASATTGAVDPLDANSGRAFLGVRAADTYEIRITPPSGHRIVAPLQTIAVSGTGDNYFDVQVETTGLPASPDSRFCRCSGTFSDAYGHPATKLRLQFGDAGTVPQLLIGADAVARGVAVRTFSVITDRSGYCSVDLIRGADYSVIMAGYEDTVLIVRVPDAASAPLVDMLFPMVDLVEYRDAGTLLTPTDTPSITISLSGEPAGRTLDATTVMRSGLRQPGLVDLTMRKSNSTVVMASTAPNGILLKPLTVGSATIWMDYRDAPQGQGTTAAPARTSARGALTVTVEY